MTVRHKDRVGGKERKKKMKDRISRFICMKIMKMKYQKIITRVKIIQATYRGI